MLHDEDGDGTESVLSHVTAQRSRGELITVAKTMAFVFPQLEAPDMEKDRRATVVVLRLVLRLGR